jgi:hypothetical protein
MLWTTVHDDANARDLISRDARRQGLVASFTLATSANPGGTWRFALLEWPSFRPPAYAHHWPRIESGMPDI